MKSTLEALEISRARQDAVSMAADLRALALAYRHSLRPDRAMGKAVTHWPSCSRPRTPSPSTWHTGAWWRN